MKKNRTTIQVEKDVRKMLKKNKLCPEESYNSMFKRILQKAKKRLK